MTSGLKGVSKPEIKGVTIEMQNNLSSKANRNNKALPSTQLSKDGTSLIPKTSNKNDYVPLVGVGEGYDQSGSRDFNKGDKIANSSWIESHKKVNERNEPDLIAMT